MSVLINGIRELNNFNAVAVILKHHLSEFRLNANLF